MRHAVFPGGARIRPRLSMAVAMACGETDPAAPLAAASAIEFLHCASLVHDDLPCFDDADIRRGQPSVHKAFGEPLAVLAGDALIVLAFETLARGTRHVPDRLGALVAIVGGAVGSRGGIVAGQAWESEPVIETALYHRAKTGALFAGATMAGAAAAGAKSQPWRALGEGLGEAFQAADDIRDVACSEEELGKPVGQDAVCERPNIATQLGVRAAIRHLDDLVAHAVESIPPCPGALDLRALILRQAQGFLPEGLALRAA
jgi:geranylgeranyl diphosphate synthase type II